MYSEAQLHFWKITAENVWRLEVEFRALESWSFPYWLQQKADLEAVLELDSTEALALNPSLGSVGIRSV